MYSSFVAFRSVKERSSDTKNVTVGVPLNALDEHASVDQNRHFVVEVLHKLKSTALIGDAERSTVFIDVFITEALAV